MGLCVCVSHFSMVSRKQDLHMTSLDTSDISPKTYPYSIIQTFDILEVYVFDSMSIRKKGKENQDSDVNLVLLEPS